MAETKTTENKKLSIYQKILNVMKAVEYLQKDDNVEFLKTKYKAISEEKVTSTVRKQFVEQGLIMYPFEQEISKDGNITTTNTKYRLVNVDNPEESIVIASSGQGADSQDKGSGKAMTYSFKYALLRTFAIPTGEDPDKISSAELDAVQQNEEEAKAYHEKEDALRKELKELLETTKSDVPKFLEWATEKYERKIASVDEMLDLELKDAIKTIKKSKGVK